MCEKTLEEEGYSRDEIDQELMEIKCQLGYLHCLKGIKNDFDKNLLEQSLLTYSSFDKQQISNKSLVTLISWNLACIKCSLGLDRRGSLETLHSLNQQDLSAGIKMNFFQERLIVS